MDAYQVYYNTFRYVMNAKPEDKATWSDIFKYIPYLHQMLLCCVCGKLLKHPHGPVNTVCLHHVCHGCIGGKMRLKPSCSWCKDHTLFAENKRLRILVLCFKRLCAYISHSKLGFEISKVATNGHVKDSEITKQVLKDADEFFDDYPFTPLPDGLPKYFKPLSHGHNRMSHFNASQPSTSGIVMKNFTNGSNSRTRAKANTNMKRNVKSGYVRGRQRKNVSHIPVKPAQSNTSIHIKRLKRKAMTARNSVTAKKFQLKKLPSTGRYIRRKPPPDSSGLLISQRPHRELSGKFSIGQLWRETFLEEKPPEPEIYPDSGIEIGNASDQDHSSQPPLLKHENELEKSSTSKVENPEKVIHVRDTRLHPAPELKEKSEHSETGGQHKPRLTLTISKSRLSQGLRKGQQKSSAVIKIKDVSNSSLSDFVDRFPNRLSNLKRRGLNSRSDLKKRRDICRCARFKQPNQLTCFGQKCPCYRDRKACVDCLCNGCKNPRRKLDSVPSLLHGVVNESSCIQHGIDPTMPRLSPIPRM